MASIADAAGKRTARSARNWIAIAVIAVLSVLAVYFLVGIVKPTRPPLPAHAQSTAHVMLSDPSGHGSGVHIGDGYILTAAHVVGEEKSMTMKASNGSIQDATVLWKNTQYDVALLRIDRFDAIESAALNCAPNPVGQSVRAFGNPADLEFVWTKGEVVGTPIQYDAWKSVVPVNITVIPGQSGGGILSDDGEVVGLTVGVMLVPMEIGYWRVAVSIVGVGYIVPASVVCMLLDRK